MPRSSGGRRGSSSSGSSSSDTIRRNVATSVALNSASESFERITGDSRSCQVVFEMHEKTHIVANGFKVSKREEKIQRKATAAGFATAYDYLKDQHEKDPALCRSRFKLYKECIRKNPGNEAACDYYRNNCQQFKS